MSLKERLAPGNQPDAPAKQRVQHPAGYEPGVEWDGTSGVLNTGPVQDQPACWDDLIRRWGMDPADVEIVEPVHRRSWESQTKDGAVITLNYFKANLRKKRTGTASVDELVKLIKRGKPAKVAPSGELAYVVPVGDLQLGKPDGDGTEGTVRRFVDKTDAAVDRLRELRRNGRSLGTIYLPWLGDCIEGISSQGGRLVMRLELTITEQVRLYRRLMLHQVQTFAPLCDRLIIPVVPGNHDEAHRIGDKMATRWDDSWAIEGASAVADGLKINDEAYGHVSFVFPKRDELTITLDMAGTTVALAHGHQWRTGKAVDWWARQSHGMQPVGDATVLLSAHLHHLHVLQTGKKLHCQIPALDGGSSWYRHATGADSPAGMVTMVVGPEHDPLRDLAVL